MNNTEIVQALKDNKYPFGLMTEEMQDAARDNKGDKWLKFGYNNNIWGEIEVEVDYGEFEPTSTYRLRPDYKEEQEVVEWKVEDQNGMMRYVKDGTAVELMYAINATGFMGFKYADGKTRTEAIYYQLDTHTNTQCDTDSLLNNEVEVLTPTAVLFKGRDND